CALILKYLRCPHGGNDIRGVPTDPDDGANVCPECGYVWRLEPEGAVRYDLSALKGMCARDA
ncbi:MAG: hypothetical protein ACYS7M_13610, partial [Planctomycetota bacterium]